MSIFKEIYRNSKFTLLFMNDTTADAELRFGGGEMKKSPIFAAGNAGIKVAGLPLTGVTDQEALNFLSSQLERYPAIVNKMHISGISKLVGGTMVYEMATYDKLARQEDSLNIDAYQQQSDIVQVPASLLLAGNTALSLKVQAKTAGGDPVNVVRIDFFIAGLYDGTQQVNTPFNGGSMVSQPAFGGTIFSGPVPGPVNGNTPPQTL